jgi:hypothetical protein
MESGIPDLDHYSKQFPVGMAFEHRTAER